MAGDLEALRQGFETKADRSGEHHLRTGAKKEDGTGLLKVDRRMATAPRTSRELAHGSVLERMQQRVHDLHDGLRLLVTQISEAAIKAEELAVGAVAPDARTPGLTDAVDGLTAIRVALESLDTTAHGDLQ